MATTPNRGYQLPAPGSKLKDDVLRLIAAFGAIDTDVANLLLALADKSNVGHGHAMAEITGLVSALGNKLDVGYHDALANLTDVDVAGVANGMALLRQASKWIPVALQVNNVSGLEIALNGKVSLTGDADVDGLKKFVGGTVQVGADAGTRLRLRYDGFVSEDGGGTWHELWHSGNFSVSAGLANTDVVELNRLGNGDRYAIIDFVSHGAPDTIDYSARINRNPGANGDLEINQTGSGVINFTGGSELQRNGSKIWDAGNDGAGSGLDADLLHGQPASYFMAAGRSDSVAIWGFWGGDGNNPYFRHNNDSVTYLQTALGFTPVQQGGGTGQGTNKVYLGWSGSGLRLQVDASDQGFFAMDHSVTRRDSHGTLGEHAITAVGTSEGQLVAGGDVGLGGGTWKTLKGGISVGGTPVRLLQRIG